MSDDTTIPASVPADPSDDQIAQLIAEEQAKESAPPDEVEVDWEGEKFKVPGKLKDALLREADYRKKTAEVAEQRKKYEAEAAQFREQQSRAAETMEFQRKFMADVGRVRVMDEQLAEYANVDWDAWQAQDQAAHDKGWRQFQRLKDARDTMNDTIYKKMTKAQEESKAEREKQRAEFETKVKERIKDWSPARKAEMAKALNEHWGIDEAAFDGITDPRVAHLAADAVLARKWMAMAAAKRQAVTDAGASVPNITPPARLGGGGASQASRDPSKMSMAEYAEWMNKRDRRERG